MINPTSTSPSASTNGDRFSGIVLILAPTRRDASITERVLQQERIPTGICDSLSALADQLNERTAAVVLTDDVLTVDGLPALRVALERQPGWSDLPFVVLAAAGVLSPRLASLQGMASLTLLDRQVQIRTLLSAVQMAVRARTRQYQIRDLLERDRLARIEADRANQAKDRFLAVLSHELRTPLTPIVFALAALQRELERPAPQRRSLDARLPRLLEMMSRNIGLETKLIDDLLDINRVIQGKLQLQTGPLDLHEPLRNSLTMIETDARAKGVTLQVTLEAQQTRVMADPARLHQVFWNLLRNAVKFTGSGGTVSLQTRNDGARLVVVCGDDGIGIAPEILPRIFEPFEQGSQEVTRHYGGLGLGLAISRSLVEAHGGSLHAHSDGIGRGATFTVMLPLADAAASIPADAPIAVAERRSPRRVLHILLVEDHMDTALVVLDALQDRGHRVRVAHGVGEALFAATAERFDVLISDIGLPDGSGLHLLRQLAPGPLLGAIAMSGFGMDEDLTRSRDAGFDAHLTKPIDASTLNAAIGALIDARDSPSGSV